LLDVIATIGNAIIQRNFKEYSFFKPFVIFRIRRFEFTFYCFLKTYVKAIGALIVICIKEDVLDE